MIQDIVAKNSTGTFGETIESGKHFIRIELTLCLENPAVEKGAYMVNPILYGFQIEEQKAFEKGRRLGIDSKAIRSILIMA